MSYTNKEIIGLSDRERYSIYRFQENESFCWAAAVQMVLLQHDIYVDQKELADGLNSKKIFDKNAGSSLQTVETLLDGWEYMEKIIKAKSFEGLPNAEFLINEIRNNNPIIIGVWEEIGKEYGHAVVLTNLEIVKVDGVQYISKIIILDPDNSAEVMSTNGLRYYEGGDISKILRTFLVIKT